MQTLAVDRLLRVVIPALIALIATPALGYTGTLGNNLNVPVTYQVGIPDAQGHVAWESHTLGPCEAHDWSWDQGGEPNLHMLWPQFFDERRNESGDILMNRGGVPMSPQGGLSVFFPYGDQIWLDTSSGATLCTAAAVATPTPTPTPTPKNGAGTVAVTPAPTPMPDAGPSFSNADEVRSIIADARAIIERAQTGELLILQIPYGAGTSIVPISVELFIQMLQFRVIEGEMSEEQAAGLIGTSMGQSLLLTRAIRNRLDDLTEQLDLGAAIPR